MCKTFISGNTRRVEWGGQLGQLGKPLGWDSDLDDSSYFRCISKKKNGTRLFFPLSTLPCSSLTRFFFRVKKKVYVEIYTKSLND